MSKQPIRVSENHSDQVIWIMSWRALGFFVILALLILFAWLYTQKIVQEPAWWDVLGLAALHALLTLIIERAMATFPVRQVWRYRFAFFASVSVFVIHWVVIWIAPSQSLGYLWFFDVVFGAYIGGLFANGIDEGLWENNSPPSLHVQQEVYQRHLEVIGVPGPIPIAKRLFDVVLASTGILISMPVWLLSSFLVWIEDPGPLLFVKNSVGKGGVNFHQYKFRTMVRGAESNTGPILASETDERVLIIGSLLRKTALDELPQLINILGGEMSFVGPRPQRTVLVRGYLERMPEYAERHRVLPGLAGLAQVAGDYYLTPRQKLRYDRIYIRHTSLSFDIKLIFLAFLLTFWYRWQKDWNGRIPRKLIRWGS